MQFRPRFTSKNVSPSSLFFFFLIFSCSCSYPHLIHEVPGSPILPPGPLRHLLASSRLLATELGETGVGHQEDTSGQMKATRRTLVARCRPPGGPVPGCRGRPEWPDPSPLPCPAAPPAAGTGSLSDLIWGGGQSFHKIRNSELLQKDWTKWCS